MSQSDNFRKGRRAVRFVALTIGFILGLFLDLIVEKATGVIVRNGFSTDARAALLKAGLGGVIGYVGAMTLETLLRKARRHVTHDDTRN